MATLMIGILIYKSVRAILGALGYINIMWSKDSGDANGVTADIAAASIKSWFVAQPGFVSLQHNIDALTTGVAIGALNAIKTLGSSFPLKPKTVAQGLGDLYGYRKLNTSKSSLNSTKVIEKEKSNSFKSSSFFLSVSMILPGLVLSVVMFAL